MSPSRDEVLALLAGVHEPTVRRSIVELGMVRDVKAARGGASVELAIPVDDWFQVDELRSRVVAALAGLDGRRDAEVRIDTMSDSELDAFGTVLEAAPKFTDKGSETRVLGVSSGKGGVGKSSVTVNTAVALAQLGNHVGILDADIYGFSIPRMLGVTEPPIAVSANALVPPVAHGVSCVSMDFFAPEDRAVMWRGPMLHKALQEFMTKVYWGEPDYLLFDMPPGTGDVALSMAQHLPRAEMLIVTTPQAAAQRVARKAALMARDPSVNLDVVGVVENMSWFTGDDGKRYEIFGSGGGRMLAQELGVAMVGQVPLVVALREGGDEGEPITVTDPASEVSLAFQGIAKWLEANPPKRIYKRQLKIV